MHHSLRVYSRYRELFLRYYIFQAKWTGLPLIGKLVRKVANLYGKRASGAYLRTLQEANEIIDNSDGLALGPCTCRIVFKNCENPTNTEIMLSLGHNIFFNGRPYEGITIHYQLTDYLIIPEHLALLEHSVYQGSFPMVYMGDNSDISYVMAIIHILVHIIYLLSRDNCLL